MTPTLEEITRAMLDRGQALFRAGRHGEALETFERMLTQRADDPVAHNAKAAVLINLERLEEALGSCEQASRLAAQWAAPHSNRGAALKGLKRYAEALISCDRAIALQPDYLMAHLNRAAVLRELQRIDEALESYNRALELQPNVAEIHANRAPVLQDLQQPEEALASCDRAIQLQPDCTLAHINRGGALHDLMRLDEALGSYVQAQLQQPKLDRAFANASFIWLQRGYFEQGWELFERRRRPGPVAGSTWGRAAWTGTEPVNDRTLFIYWEQGLGDTLQFCRYIRLLRERGARVQFSVQDRLRALLRGCDPEVQLLAQSERPAQFDFHSPLLSLPRAFGTSLSTIPAQVPYLHAEPDRVAAWRERLGTGGFKIGVYWQGNPIRSIDAGRSFPLLLLRPLSMLPGVRLISLQKGPGESQLDTVPADMCIERLGAGFDAGADGFVDCAAVMQSLDLIITSDTSIAHLAGALGRPTWTLLKHVPDWRWLLGRNDSPWYPTMRLFRQPRRGDWEAVAGEVLRALEVHLQERAAREPRRVVLAQLDRGPQIRAAGEASR